MNNPHELFSALRNLRPRNSGHWTAAFLANFSPAGSARTATSRASSGVRNATLNGGGISLCRAR